MKIIDVTLRDGGFTCDFDWPMKFAQEYYKLLSKLDVNLVELGYWKQTAKSSNRFFDLNIDNVNGNDNDTITIDANSDSDGDNDNDID